MVWNATLKRDIPEGWEVANIRRVLDKVITTPRVSAAEYLQAGSYPVIDQTTDVYCAGFTERQDAVVNQYPAVVFGDHSCVVKYVNFPFARGADGTQVILSKEKNVSIEYLYCFMKDVKIKKGYARHFGFLKEHPIILPSEKEAKKFQGTVQILFEQITRNRKENLSLTRLRDELLPLLMNGQVSVNYDLVYQTPLFLSKSTANLLTTSRDHQHFVSQLGERRPSRLPDDKERLRHIFRHQVYGLAPTECICRIALRYILGFDDKIHILDHNLRRGDCVPAAKAGRMSDFLDEVFGKTAAQGIRSHKA